MRPRSAILIAVLSLAAFAAPAGDGFGPGGAFRIESPRLGFDEGRRGIIETHDGRAIFYPLPQSAFDEYKKLHPDEDGIGLLTEKTYDRREMIGPFQIEDDKLWFGKTFYNGEGMRGVGAFGYFDFTTRQYQLYSPAEVAPWEISAILVEKDYVWLGLDQFVEDISTVPVGLVRWDRATHQVKSYPLEFAVGKIERRGPVLRLETLNGYAEFRDGVIHRFEIRRTASGAFTVVPLAKFPPPPSHY